MADLEALETFVTAVRTGSFAAAARALGITPAMVGRRIAALEQRYGARLIERTTRAQRLTETGEGFLLRAEAVLDAAADLDDAMHSAPGRLEGRIRMTGPATLGTYRLATLVGRFCGANPAVTVEMVLSDRRADLIAEGFDLAVRIGRLPSSSMIVRLVGTYSFALVAAPDLVARHGLPAGPADLGRFPCLINLNMSPRSQWPFTRGAESAVAEVSGPLQIDNGEALRAACLEGAGIAYLPVDLVEHDLQDGKLVRLLSDWLTVPMPIQIVHPSRKPPRRIGALIDAFAAGLRETHPI